MHRIHQFESAISWLSNQSQPHPDKLKPALRWLGNLFDQKMETRHTLGIAERAARARHIRDLARTARGSPLKIALRKGPKEKN